MCGRPNNVSEALDPMVEGENQPWTPALAHRLNSQAHTFNFTTTEAETGGSL